MKFWKNAVIIIWSSVVVITANAHTLNERECVRVAADIYVDTIDKVNGATFVDQFTLFDKGLPMCQASGGCAYKDAQDVQFIYDFLGLLYSGRLDNLTPDQIVENYEKTCKRVADAVAPEEK